MSPDARIKTEEKWETRTEVVNGRPEPSWEVSDQDWHLLQEPMPSTELSDEAIIAATASWLTHSNAGSTEAALQYFIRTVPQFAPRESYPNERNADAELARRAHPLYVRGKSVQWDYHAMFNTLDDATQVGSSEPCPS
jgi:hypothetical protein